MNTIRVNGSKVTNNFGLSIRNNIIVIDNLEEISVIYEHAQIDLKFIIKSDCKIFEYINNSKINNNYEMIANMVINRFSVNSSLKTVIDMNAINTNLDYFYATINEDDNNYVIDINHNVKMTNAKVINHGINYRSKKLDFLINSRILKESSLVNSNQDSKIILMEDNTALIKPNLLVFNDDISANHASYIGYFDKNKVFYLASRGINEMVAIKLLAKAFLLGDRDITFLQREMILKDINSYWG